MSDKNIKVTLYLKSHHTITFDCKDFKIFCPSPANVIKELEVLEPDENYPIYLDLNDIASITLKKIQPVAGFANRIGFDNKI